MREIKIIKLNDEYLYQIQTIHMTGHHISEPMDTSAVNSYLENKLKEYKIHFWELEKMYKKAKKQGYESTTIQMYKLMIDQKEEHDKLRDIYIKFASEMMKEYQEKKEVKDV